MKTSTRIVGTSTEVRHSRLLSAAKEDLLRLEAAAKAGWDVAAELERTRLAIKAFSKGCA